VKARGIKKIARQFAISKGHLNPLTARRSIWIRRGNIHESARIDTNQAEADLATDGAPMRTD